MKVLEYGNFKILRPQIVISDRRVNAAALDSGEKKKAMIDSCY